MPVSAMEASKMPASGRGSTLTPPKASNPVNMVRGARSGTTAPANYKPTPTKQPTRRKKRRPAVK